jgi:anti-sigma factor RsiW
MNGQRGPHVPEELGAHVLGLLDAAQSRAVEEHLAGCPDCRRDWEELRGMVDLLDDVPPEAFLDGPPDGGDLLLQKTLRQVRTETGARRRRRGVALVGAAAVLGAGVLAGGVGIGRTIAPTTVVAGAPAPAPAPPPAISPDAMVITGEGDPGVTMTAAVTPATGWVRLRATVAGIPEGERCQMMVVDRDGNRHIAGGWLVSAAGSRDGTTLDGSALVAPDDVAAVVIQNEDGHEFAVAEV